LLPGPVDPEVIAATEATARLLSDLGHDVAPVELSAPDPDMFTQAFLAVWNTGSAGLPLDHSKMEPPLTLSFFDSFLDFFLPSRPRRPLDFLGAIAITLNFVVSWLGRCYRVPQL
jgi:hypothetical protein